VIGLALSLWVRSLIKMRRDTEGRLTTTELKRRLETGEDILVLDVRGGADYAGQGGHIPGARNIPLRDVPGKLGDLAPWKERSVAVVCTTNIKSGKAAKLLRKSAFARVLLVGDGMSGWAANGF
jgi:rhodanese-related sulfurtransferase